MSTIKVNSIKNTATNDGGIAIDNSGHVQIDGQQLPSAGALSNRNLMINGAMQVAQRGTSKTGLGNGDSGYHTVDRFRFGEHSTPTCEFTMIQSTDAPEGFRYSMRLDTTTAQATLATLEAIYMETKLEGRDLGRLKYGTSNAENITLSFHVKGSTPGTYVIWLYNPSGTDSACTQTYTIQNADEWEYKQITIAGDTALAISDTVDTGMHVRWILAAGPDYTSGTTSTTWTNDSVTNANRYGGQTVNLASSTDNDWSITGIQLEVGKKATPFEHKSYGDDLAKCQRYLFRVNADASEQSCLGVGRARNASSTVCNVPFPVAMREKTGKTCSEADCNMQHRTSSDDVSFTSITSESETSVDVRFDADTGTPFTAGDAVNLRINDGSGNFQVDSEL